MLMLWYQNATFPFPFPFPRSDYAPPQPTNKGAVSSYLFAQRPENYSFHLSSFPLTHNRPIPHRAAAAILPISHANSTGSNPRLLFGDVDGVLVVVKFRLPISHQLTPLVLTGYFFHC